MSALRPVGVGAVVGWGRALPQHVVTNADLSATLDTSDEWITERTGIEERRVVPGGDRARSTSSLATEAGTMALHTAGLRAADIDQVVLATTTPDRQVPACASAVQHALGIHGGAVDLNAACSGFVYGLVHSFGLLALGAARRVLLIGAETLSRVTDWGDRNTAVLFADGAGAVVLDGDRPASLCGWDLGSDGSAEDLLYADLGGTLRMDGREVFRRAVRVSVDSAERALAVAGVDPDDIALLVPHQANIRIIDAVGQRLGIGAGRTATVLASTGNTSAASIPLALVDAVDNGRVHRGDLVLLVGFGAGMSWASAVLRWEADT